MPSSPKRSRAPPEPARATGRTSGFAAVGPDASISAIAAATLVYEQGSISDAVYFVHDGTVLVSNLSESGREAIISILGPGDFFGLDALLENVRRVNRVTTLTDCRIERIKGTTIRKVFGKAPKLARLFAGGLLKRSREIMSDLIDHHFHSTEKRLARTLLRLAQFEGDRQQGLTTPINQAMLAEMIGTTRSRVNFFMNKFRRLGMIEYSGKQNERLVVHRSLTEFLHGS
jgi:CRP/FNR family transcriptional regulator, cyclic AMP receptor protein